MSSQRLPGKVLKPLAGRTILEHVISSAKEALPNGPIVVATSTDPSDDPLADFCRRIGVQVHRGSLENVVQRLQMALKSTGAGAFYRICADSPFYDPNLMRAAGAILEATSADLVTNVFPRTYPKGRSVELARADSFLALDPDKLSKEEQEHVFSHYYSNPRKYRIENFRNKSDDSMVNLCIDTDSDWMRAENFLKGKAKPSFSYSLPELRDFFVEEKRA